MVNCALTHKSPKPRLRELSFEGLAYIPTRERVCFVFLTRSSFPWESWELWLCFCCLLYSEELIYLKWKAIFLKFQWGFNRTLSKYLIYFLWQIVKILSVQSPWVKVTKTLKCYVISFLGFIDFILIYLDR